MSRPTADDMIKAAAELMPRLGATSYEIRYSEPEHEGSPTIWLAVALFDADSTSPVAGAPPQVGAGLNPAHACYRLLEQLVDGGHCLHCHKPTAIEEDFEKATPASSELCWYVLDPELKRFRRGCEGGPT